MFEKIKNGRSTLCKVAVFSALGVLPALLTSACSSGDESASETEGPTGSVGLAIKSPDGEVIRSVSYTITNAAGDVVKKDAINVTDDRSTVSVAFSLVVAKGYTISMSAATLAGGSCSGSASFDVVKGTLTNVSLALVCKAGGGNGDVVVNGTLGPSCPRVLSETAAPLATSVGGVITLNGAASSSDATLTWTASSGTIRSKNAADTTLTCTEAGKVTVTLTATKGEQCVDTKQVEVTCVAPLPKNLVLTDCQATRVCQIEQHGNDWKAVCNSGATVLTGRIDGVNATWTALDGAACSATLVDGQLVGSCEAAGGSCAVSSKEAIPSATCIALPSQLLVDGCGSAGTRCDVVQNACSWQATCNDGKVFGGTTTATQVRWTASNRASCRSAADASLPAGTYAGACTPPSSNPTGIVACNFTLDRPADLPADPVCQPLASSFVLEGCGLENQFADTNGPAICRTTQNGCLWQATCDDFAISGRAVGGAYSFTGPDGQKCSGALKDGKLEGSCTTSAGSCNFKQRDLQPAAGCASVPAAFSIDGCGVSGACKGLQDGCNWQATCNDSVVYSGVATPEHVALFTSISDAPFWCDLSVGTSSITGGCTPYPVVPGAEPLCSITGTVTP